VLIPGGKLLVRKLAGIALAAGVLVSVAGCSFNPNPESLQSYAPSDGVGTDLAFSKADRNQSIKFRNFLILTDGTNYNLYGTIINGGSKAQSVTLQLSSDSTQSQTVSVPAGQTVVFNKDNATTVALSGKPGALLDFKVGSANGSNWTTMSVPVLDGTLSYYAPLLSPSPSASN
jgi:hypothetical protein